MGILGSLRLPHTPYLVAFICCLSHIVNYREAHSCDHVPPPPDELRRVFIETHEHHRVKRGVDDIEHNLRIHPTYDDSVSNLSADLQKLIKESVIPKAVQYWENALKTRRLNKPLRLARGCINGAIIYRNDNSVSSRQHFCRGGCSNETRCGDMVVPQQHLQGCRYYDVQNRSLVEDENPSEGVTDADFLLYVAAEETTRCQTSIAYATYCQLEVEFDRPIAGFINFCPRELASEDNSPEQNVATVKHEILHAIGFTSGLYGFYRDADGEPLTPRTAPGNQPERGPDQQFVYSNKVVKQVTRPDWLTISGHEDHTVSMMVTPKVTAEARRHFNCSTLEGAELENQGPLGTRLTHWEKRVFENELMTGIYIQNTVVSRITLALMEDTGWYMADYSYAEPLEWGRDLGCEFATESCLNWIANKQSGGESSTPFCAEVKSSPLKTGCTYERTGVAICNLQMFSESLPPVYQLFSLQPELGGKVSIADYCPYMQELKWNSNDVFARGSNCLLASNVPPDDTNLALESYGQDSRCFEQTSAFQMQTCDQTFVSTNYGSGCYKHECSESEGLLVYVNDEPYRCYKTGQVLDVKIVTDKAYHIGTLICPSCEQICKNQIKQCPAEREPPASTSPTVTDIPCSSPAGTASSFLLCITALVNFIAVL